jgi:hypothetical protein
MEQLSTAGQTGSDLTVGERVVPQPIEASTFIAGLGVNVHLNFSGTPYTSTSAVQTAMAYLGLNTMRDMGGQANLTPYAAMASAGYHFDFFAPEDPNALSPAAYAQWLDAFAKAHPGAITSIEGGNEVNKRPLTYNGSTTLAAEAVYQQAMFNAVNADPTIASTPVFNLSLGTASASDYAPLGNLSGAADYGNVHPYLSHGNQPNVELNTLISYAQAVTPGKPMAITESGYPTLATDTAQGVDQATQAKLALNLIMDAEKLGDPLFIYELVDNQDSGGGAWNYGGLFNGDWTAKPAATAIHNLTNVLTTGAGDSASAAPTYTVSGLSGYNDSLMVHENNGTYDIVFWDEPQIWNSTSHTEVPAAAQTATITLGQAVSSYSVYDPLSGVSAISTGGAASSISVQVTDHPVIVELHTNTFTATLTGDATFQGFFRQYTVGAGGAFVTGGPENANDAVVNPHRLQFVDGYMAYSPTDTAGQVYRLYQATLDRAPDQEGLTNWTSSVNSGTSLQSVANSFVASQEFQADYGALNNTDFVTLLYHNVLHRDPDGPGLNYWINTLNSGQDTRSQVVLSFSESQEDINDSAPQVQQGLWVGNQDAAEAARLYDTVFGRLPDTSGLTNWTHSLEGGMSLQTVAADFVASQEFQSKYGGLDNTGFLTLLYANVLHRAPDTPGLNTWLAALAAGTSRAQVVLDFSESPEHIADTAPHIDYGVWVA